MPTPDTREDDVYHPYLDEYCDFCKFKNVYYKNKPCNKCMPTFKLGTEPKHYKLRLSE